MFCALALMLPFDSARVIPLSEVMSVDIIDINAESMHDRFTNADYENMEHISPEYYFIRNVCLWALFVLLIYILPKICSRYLKCLISIRKFFSKE